MRSLNPFKKMRAVQKQFYISGLVSVFWIILTVLLPITSLWSGVTFLFAFLSGMVCILSFMIHFKELFPETYKFFTTDGE